MDGGTGGGEASGRAAEARPPADGWITPMWLAHHWPDEYDRCVRVGRRHVCRRCLVLYPLALAVMLLSYGATLPAPLDVLVLVLLPLPAVVEYVLEQSGVLAYDARRVVAVTVPLAVGLGRGFARYLEHLADPLFWGVVIVYGGICVAALLWSRRRDDG